MKGWTNIDVYVSRFGDIPDGLSNTLCVSETVQTTSGSGAGTVADPDDLRGYTFYGPNTFFTTHAPPNTKMPDLTTLPQYCNNALNPKHPCAPGQLSGYYVLNGFARSEHPGGVNAGLLDGSVNFYSNNIDTFVWRAMGTTKGSEAVSAP
jgi:prepilin-type processing-associated H-X9-DG protein